MLRIQELVACLSHHRKSRESQSCIPYAIYIRNEGQKKLGGATLFLCAARTFQLGSCFGDQGAPLEDVLEEDASEKDLPIDRVIPDRIFGVCLDHRSALQEMRLEDEINNDRLLSQLPWIEELYPRSKRYHMFV